MTGLSGLVSCLSGSEKELVQYLIHRTGFVSTTVSYLPLTIAPFRNSFG